ncbi:hypothetical protein HDU78_009388 [Chytriomyces hyalinus]|nr:hypothetical protein HDU78_009388 [Chytriomyces hyalinus]
MRPSHALLLCILTASISNCATATASYGHQPEPQNGGSLEDAPTDTPPFDGENSYSYTGTFKESLGNGSGDSETGKWMMVGSAVFVAFMVFVVFCASQGYKVMKRKRVVIRPGASAVEEDRRTQVEGLDEFKKKPCTDKIMSKDTTSNITDAVVSKLPPFTFGTHAADFQEISVATLAGACSGFASKKILKGAGLAVGLGFMSLQALTYTGVVKVDWQKIESKISSGLDVDGDGKLTPNDFKSAGLRFIHNLSTDLPSAGGFAGGFFLGFARG